jgi:uncharacterized protein YkuJ
VIRARERVRVQVVRGGRVVAEVESEGNTLTSAFLTKFRTEVTENADYQLIKPLYAMGVRYGTALYGSATLTPADITVDDVNMMLKVTKGITVNTTGQINCVVLWMESISPENEVTVVYLDSPLAVSAGDIVNVQYTGNFYMVAENLKGILADATLDHRNMTLRVMQRLAGLVTDSLRVARVDYLDPNAVTVMSVNTQNDTANYTVVAPQTTAPQTFDLKTIKFCDSQGRTLLTWLKATALRVPAGFALSVRVQVA